MLQTDEQMPKIVFQSIWIIFLCNCFRIPRPLGVSWCHCRKEEVLLSPDDGGGEDGEEVLSKGG